MTAPVLRNYLDPATAERLREHARSLSPSSPASVADRTANEILIAQVIRARPEPRHYGAKLVHNLRGESSDELPWVGPDEDCVVKHMQDASDDRALVCLPGQPNPYVPVLRSGSAQLVDGRPLFIFAFVNVADLGWMQVSRQQVAHAVAGIALPRARALL